MNLRGQIITGRVYNLNSNELYPYTVTGEVFDLVQHKFTFWLNVKGINTIFTCESDFFVVAKITLGVPNYSDLFHIPSGYVSSISSPLRSDSIVNCDIRGVIKGVNYSFTDYNFSNESKTADIYEKVKMPFLSWIKKSGSSELIPLVTSADFYLGARDSNLSDIIYFQCQNKQIIINPNLSPDNYGTIINLISNSDSGTGNSGPTGPDGNTGPTGGGSVISTGSKALVVSPYIATITNWYITAGVTGSAVVDIKRNGVSIIGAGNKPTLSAQNYATASVSSWTSTSVSIGDILEFNVDSASTITNLNVVIKINK